MPHRIYFTTVVLAGLLSLGGCAKEATSTTKATTNQGARAKAQSPSREMFDAYIEPLNATKLRAPQNTFRIDGWVSDSSWIKLVMLVPDGKKVKKGELVGKFEFRAKRALERVESKLRNVNAQRDKALVEKRAKTSQLTTDIGLKSLQAKQAKLDTKKEGLVSSRDLERFEIALKQAEFEAKADKQKLGAYRRSLSAQLKFQDQQVSQAELTQKNYYEYESRFKVKAPHDGVVRHAFNRRRRRKIQQGDGMPGGKYFVSLAKDDALGVVFYIPESRYSILSNHKKFLVHSPSSDETYPVTISRVDEFPQELGFLKENDELPNAREKVYVVYASFETQPKALSAGLELKVGLP